MGPPGSGREVLFTLKTTRPYWQTHPILNADQIAEALGDQLDSSQSTFKPASGIIRQRVLCKVAYSAADSVPSCAVESGGSVPISREGHS